MEIDGLTLKELKTSSDSGYNENIERELINNGNSIGS